MYTQIYFDYNSNGEDLQNLKNFCATKNLHVETYNSHSLIKQTTYNTKIKTRQRPIKNIVLIWSDTSNSPQHQEIKEFCIQNLINLTYLYTIANGFTTQTQSSVTTPNQIQKMFNVTKTTQYSELFLNLQHDILYKMHRKIENPHTFPLDL